MWMRVRRTNAVCPPLVTDRPAAEGERPLVLRDLVALGKIGIEVVLAREDRRRLHVAPERQRRLDRVIDRGPIEYGSAPGSPRQTGHTWEFGGAPKSVLHEQKIFVCVRSCA
jgi:hypothetical protein